MPIASVRLPEDLKEAVARLARQEGRTPHAFLLEAIQEKVEATRLRQALVREAREALEDFESTGEAVDARSMRKWIEARGAGRKVAAPPARKWQK